MQCSPYRKEKACTYNMCTVELGLMEYVLEMEDMTQEAFSGFF
jgi:hypothetical protein